MTRDLRWRRARIAVAALMLGGLTAALADFRQLVPPAVAHWLAAVQLVPASVGLAAGLLASAIIVAGLLLLTLAAGRVYCSVICPLGILQDVISRAARWLRGRHDRPLRFAPARTWLRQLFLWGTMAGIALGASGLALALMDPYSNFGRIAGGLVRPFAAELNNRLTGPANAAGWSAFYRVDLPAAAPEPLLAAAAALALVAVLAALRGRLYCNTICPVGTLLGLVARRAAFRIAIDPDACTHCASCARACKAQCIDLRSNSIDFSRCVACYNCVGACDERGIGYRFSWFRPAPRPVAAGRRNFLAASAAGLAATVALPPNRAATTAQAGPEKLDAKFGEPSAGLAPPGAGGVDRFLDRCTSCHLCVSACPSHVLAPAFLEYGLRGFLKPRLDFAASFCDYDCRRCAEVCPDGALTLLPVAEKQLARVGVAYFHREKCIVEKKGTDCAACSEHCPTKAVYTVPHKGNLRLPEVDRELCIGCGACEHACPVVPDKAITVTGLREHGRAKRAVDAKIEPAKKAEEFPF